jgi:hypothetical protein
MVKGVVRKTRSESATSEGNGVVWGEFDWNVTPLATNRSESRIEFSLNRKRTHLGTKQNTN